MSDDKKEPGDADDAPAPDDAPAVAERTPLDLFLEAIDQSKHLKNISGFISDDYDYVEDMSKTDPDGLKAQLTKMGLTEEDSTALMEALPKHSAALIITSYIRSVPTRRADKKRDAMISFMFKYEKMGEHAERVTRFMRYAAGVKQGRIEKGNMTARLFAMDSTQTKKKRTMRRRRSSLSKGSMRASVYDNSGDLEIEGYLDKRTTGLRAKWVRRFFSVRGHYAKYYENDQKEEVKAALDLKMVTSVVLDKGVNITLEMGEMAPMKLIAPKETARNWVKAFVGIAECRVQFIECPQIKVSPEEERILI